MTKSGNFFNMTEHKISTHFLDAFEDREIFLHFLKVFGIDKHEILGLSSPGTPLLLQQQKQVS